MKPEGQLLAHVPLGQASHPLPVVHGLALQIPPCSEHTASWPGAACMPRGIILVVLGFCTLEVAT